MTTVLQEIQIKRYSSLKVRLYRELIEDLNLWETVTYKFNFKYFYDEFD